MIKLYIPYAAALLTPSLVRSKVIDINASNAQAVDAFYPDTVTADVGDVLVFHFFPRMHNVVKGTFDSPCQPAAGGFFSGNIRGGDDGKENGTTFSVLVENTEPIWFFCEVGDHCSNGMVGVVNPPSGGPSIEDWKSLSSGVEAGKVDVAAGYGGKLGTIDTPPAFDPLHPQVNDNETPGEGGEGSSPVGTVTGLLTDSSGVSTMTGTRSSNSTYTTTKTGGVGSLVPSWDAAPRVDGAITGGLFVAVMGLFAGFL